MHPLCQQNLEKLYRLDGSLFARGINFYHQIRKECFSLLLYVLLFYCHIFIYYENHNLRNTPLSGQENGKPLIE